MPHATNRTGDVEPDEVPFANLGDVFPLGADTGPIAPEHACAGTVLPNGEPGLKIVEQPSPAASIAAFERAKAMQRRIQAEERARVARMRAQATARRRRGSPLCAPRRARSGERRPAARQARATRAGPDDPAEPEPEPPADRGRLTTHAAGRQAVRS